MIWRVLGLLSLTWAYRHEDIVPAFSSIQTAIAINCVMYASSIKHCWNLNIKKSSTHACPM